MHARDAARITIQNANNFNIGSFIEKVILKAIYAAAYAGGSSCFIDLRGPAAENKDAIVDQLQALGYRVRRGMTFQGGMIQISIGWHTEVEAQNQALRVPVEPIPAEIPEVRIHEEPAPLALPAPVPQAGDLAVVQGQVVMNDGEGNNVYLVNNNAIAGGNMYFNGALAVNIGNPQAPTYDLIDED